MVMLDSTINRVFGSRIYHAMKKLDPGTRIKMLFKRRT